LNGPLDGRREENGVLCRLSFFLNSSKGICSSEGPTGTRIMKQSQLAAVLNVHNFYTDDMENNGKHVMTDQYLCWLPFPDHDDYLSRRVLSYGLYLRINEDFEGNHFDTCEDCFGWSPMAMSVVTAREDTEAVKSKTRDAVGPQSWIYAFLDPMIINGLLGQGLQGKENQELVLGLVGGNASCAPQNPNQRAGLHQAIFPLTGYQKYEK